MVHSDEENNGILMIDFYQSALVNDIDNDEVQTEMYTDTQQEERYSSMILEVVGVCHSNVSAF